jgi:phosphatidylglycerol:prolipoprotein diacylglycerol transferase
MEIMDIAFPNLGIYLRNMPKSFTVFGFEIALYGVIIGIGVIAGILMAARQAKVTGQDPDLYWDFSIYAVILSVVGARIYYVIFEWDMYKDNLLKIFNIREGGLAIYGGVIAGFSTLFVYAALKKQKAFRMADTAVTGLILGQAIGRWGNFTNREVFGEYTDNLLAMRLPVAAVRERDISESILAHMGEGINYIQVHPTFLYESLWNLGVLVLMLFYWKHKKFDGEIALLYLGGYGLGRAWIEGIRTDQLFIPGTVYPVSQVLAILLFAGAVLCDLIVRRRKKKSPA